ncbi:hypothetical protein HDZ31DRAFT_80485 [Schizophyllum fasciatum]
MNDSDTDADSSHANVWSHPDNVTLSMQADRLINIVDTDADGEVPSYIQELVDCLDCDASAHQWLSTWDSAGTCGTAHAQHDQALKEQVSKETSAREQDRPSEVEREILNELYPMLLHCIPLLQHSANRMSVVTPDIMNIFYRIIHYVYKDHVQFSGAGATYAIARPLQDHPPLDPSKYLMTDIIVLSNDIPPHFHRSHASQSNGRADDSDEELMGPPRTELAKTTAATVSAAGTTDAEMEDVADQIDREAQLLKTESDEPQGLAALCVAQLSQLPSVLASAVYHRQYRGSSDPVIGVGYSRQKGSVRVVIAWLDHQKNDEVGLRGIRLAPLSSTKFPSTNFDLCEPVEVIRLALFLIRAQKIHSTSPASDRPWRADTWAPNSIHSTKGNIAQWVDEIQNCPVPSVDAPEDIVSLEKQSTTSSVG